MPITIEQNPPPLASPLVLDGQDITTPWATWAMFVETMLQKIAAEANTGPSGPSDIEWDTLTPAASITIDLSGFKFKGKKLTPTADTTFAAPTGTQQGNALYLVIDFGATTYAITFDAAWKMAPEDEVIRLANTRTVIHWVVGPGTTINRVSFSTGVPI